MNDFVSAHYGLFYGLDFAFRWVAYSVFGVLLWRILRAVDRTW